MAGIQSETLATKLKRLRKQQGMTQAEVARMADLDVRTYGDLERGYRPGGKPVDPRPDTLARVASVLCVDLRALIPDPVSELSPHGNRLSFAECRTDFLQWENHIDYHVVEISSLAIDLADGWENVVAAINRCQAQSMEFNILMLGNKIGSFSEHLPAIVRDLWIPSAAKAREHIKRQLSLCSSQQKSIKIKVKTYCRVPTIHGMRARKKGKTKWWLTKCRLTKNILETYEWGQNDFVVLDDRKSGNHQRAKDYDQLFAELWAQSKDSEIDVEFQPPR